MYFIKKIKGYRYNYLLIGAVAAYCTFLFSFLFFYPESKEFVLAHGRFKDVNFIFVLLYGILMAPVLEELIFRGAFTHNKVLRLISFVGLPLFLYAAKGSRDITLIIFFFYLVLFLATAFIGQKKYLFALLLFTNALLFALAHYDKVYWHHIMTFSFLLNQFAAGLLLLWIVLNWNIKRAILVHATFNFLIFFPSFLMLQFPSDKVYIQQIEHYEIKWQRVPVLNNKTMLMKNDFEVFAKNITPLFLYETFVKKKKTLNLVNKDVYKYNIEIKKIDATATQLDSILVKNILLKAGLIEAIENNE